MIRFIFKYSKFLETTQLILSAKFQTLTFGEGTPPPPHTHCKKTSIYYVIFGSQNERQKWRKLFFLNFCLLHVPMYRYDFPANKN